MSKCLRDIKNIVNDDLVCMINYYENAEEEECKISYKYETICILTTTSISKTKYHSTFPKIICTNKDRSSNIVITLYYSSYGDIAIQSIDGLFTNIYFSNFNTKNIEIDFNDEIYLNNKLVNYACIDYKILKQILYLIKLFYNNNIVIKQFLIEYETVDLYIKNLTDFYNSTL